MLDAVRWLVGATDWSTAGILALIVLADGLRRAPPDAVLVRKVGAGDWAVAPRGARRPRLTLVSWGAPFVTTLLLPAGGAGAPDPSWRERFGWLARRLWALRLLAGAALLLVVLGVPVVTAAAAGGGFVAAVAAVFVVSATTACAAWMLVRPSGERPDGALAWAAHLLSPFTTPRAVEMVLERWCAGQSQLAVLRLLLPAAAFESWVRPRAFDRTRPGGEPDPELDALLDAATLRALVARAPAALAPGQSYCPRCEGVYAEAPGACPDCAVPLVPATRPS